MRRRMVLIAGCPGVGKSTIAERVGERLQAMILDADVYKRRFADPTRVTEEIDPPEIRWLYYSAALEHAFRLFESGAASTVVLEEVFHLEELRQRIDAECRARGVRPVWVEVSCPRDVIARRLETGGREGHILSVAQTLEMYERFLEVFEGFPGNGDHIAVSNDGEKPLEELVRNVLRRM